MKITFKHRADYYFWAFALVVIIKGLISYALGNEGTVINIQDSYYIISPVDSILLNGGLLIVIGFIYYALYAAGIPLIKKITKLHTSACMMVYLTAWIALPVMDHYHSQPVVSLPWFTAPDVMLIVFILLFILIQLFLLINAAIGIVKKLQAGN